MGETACPRCGNTDVVEIATVEYMLTCRTCGRDFVEREFEEDDDFDADEDLERDPFEEDAPIFHHG